MSAAGTARRVLLSILRTLLFAWMASCVLLYLLQRQLLFLPHGTRVDPADTDFSLLSDGVRLRGWCMNPGRSRALLYFGGNAEDIGWDRERFASGFPEHTVYLLAYRGYGASEGSPDEAALKADALALYDAVSARHTRVDVLARSLGSGIALHLAARRALGRLALITPYDSLVEVARRHYPWVPVGWLLHQRFEAVFDARRVSAPTLLLVARLDQVIPPVHAERLAAAFAHPPALRWLETDHDTVEADANYTLALRSHFR